jgi:hypothetical protein
VIDRNNIEKAMVIKCGIVSLLLAGLLRIGGMNAIIHAIVIAKSSGCSARKCKYS